MQVWLVRTGPPGAVAAAAGTAAEAGIEAGTAAEAGIEAGAAGSAGLEAETAAVAELAALLDADERARADRLEPAGRRRFTVSHGAVRIIVGRCLDTAPQRIRWSHGRYGKPALADATAGLEVNLSHSGDLAVVAVSRGRPVGVDVQRLLPRLDPVAMSLRYFPPVEVRFVTGADDPAERSDRFTRLWARKEACVKAAGGRLADGLRLPVHRPDDEAGREPAELLVGEVEPARRPDRAGRPGGPEGPDGPAAPGGPEWPDGPGKPDRAGGSDGTGSGRFRVRDLLVPPGYRAAVALLGADPFATTVRWWNPDD
ncbi:4'-phosphopantetheinyl transferase family protein [Plantactinospora sp. WMMB334]|uniref:4'-phosphopantetheinyl transferase family protein n=1 Tax=Plantactinospora sp. WMMB334 TaxID=3404119 RepID=UPI003B941FBF